MRWKDEWYIVNMILVFTEVLVCSFAARESMWNRMKYGTVSPLYLHPDPETEPRSNKSRFTEEVTSSTSNKGKDERNFSTVPAV
jgi:hypothetical protein